MNRRRAKKEESLRAVIYARVSSREQTENYSLQNQSTGCKRFAEKQGYEVVEEFVNDRGESAKTLEREALQRLIKFVEDRKNNIGAVIVWKVDRLSRNHYDCMGLHIMFAKLGVRVLSATEPNSDDPTGKFLRSITGAAAQLENDQRSVRTVAGMKSAIEEGRWVWHQPFGYSFRKDELGRSKLYPDDNARFVRIAFDLTAKGTYTQTEIVKMMEAAGCTNPYKQKLALILRNPIYAGWIDKPDWFPEKVKANHEALVTEEQFDLVQLVMDGKKPNTAPMLRNNPEFPLRKLVYCGKCGKPITGSFSTSRNKSKHGYYHGRCGACGFGNVKRDELHDRFTRLLEGMKISPRVVNLFEAIVSDSWRGYVEQETKRQDKLAKREAGLSTERTATIRLFVSGKLPESDYKAAVDVIDMELESIRAERFSLRSSDGRVGQGIDACKEMLQRPADFWLRSDLRTRQRFQKVVFPQGLPFFAGEFGTAPTSIVFNVLQESNGELSKMAPPAGLEPATR
jgi:site-specific DNA recombinase